MNPAARPGDVSWPGFLRPEASLSEAVAGLEATQWQSRAQIAVAQQGQLIELLRHALQHCPFHQRLGASGRALIDASLPEAERMAMFPQRWRELPLLSKPELREHLTGLTARRIPPTHLPVDRVQTSGSTGTAVSVLSTAATRHAWQALSLREHLWQRRDFHQRLGVMRYLPPERRHPLGSDMPSWGNPVTQLHPTGAGSVIHVGYPVAQLITWLRRFDPQILLTYPSVLAQLLDELAQRPPALLEVRCMAEPLDVALEQRVERQWGVRCSDVYSANEVGVIAFRCHEYARLHVQSENLLVEVLDAFGQPCRTGETGRVVVTDLHNMALPLIRYELGDYATLGEECSCGRGLPVLDRICGRVRNLARAPDGQRFWPVALGRIWAVDAVRQAQYVQLSAERIQLRVVCARALSEGERASVADKAREALGHPYAIDVLEVDSIARGPSGKFEEFMTLLDPP